MCQRLLVKQKEFKQTTKDGLIITTTTGEKPSEGVVVSRAIDCKVKVQEGDVILYDKHAGSYVQDNNEELLILFEEDVLGVRE